MVGIICNYYIKNYGSALQSLALQHILDVKNIPNSVIKYIPSPTKKQRIKILVSQRLKKISNLKVLTKYLKSKNQQKKDRQYILNMDVRNKAFDRFVSETMHFSNEYSDKQDILNDIDKYKCMLLGSDQLWCPSDLITGYHTLNWIPDHKYKATYATSFGVASLSGQLRKTVKNDISKINSISVRETSGAKIIEEGTGISPTVVLDPTLLLSEDEWNTLIPEKKIVDEKYIFCYFLANNEDHKKWAKELSQKTGCKIITLPHLESYDISGKEFGDIQLWDVTPGDFVNLIRNAEYVLSDSFHVSIFSILHRKRFLVFERYSRNSSDSRNTRIDNLLNITGLQNRLFSGGDVFNAANFINDYDKAHKMIEVEKEKSLKYLNSVFNKVGYI